MPYLARKSAPRRCKSAVRFGTRKACRTMSTPPKSRTRVASCKPAKVLHLRGQNQCQSPRAAHQHLYYEMSVTVLIKVTNPSTRVHKELISLTIQVTNSCQGVVIVIYCPCDSQYRGPRGPAHISIHPYGTSYFGSQCTPITKMYSAQDSHRLRCDSAD